MPTKKKLEGFFLKFIVVVPGLLNLWQGQNRGTSGLRGASDSHDSRRDFC